MIFHAGITSDSVQIASVSPPYGDQGGAMLHGDPPDECVCCDLFDKCHKMTTAAMLQALSLDVSLIVQNGLARG